MIIQSTYSAMLYPLPSPSIPFINCLIYQSYKSFQRARHALSSFNNKTIISRELPINSLTFITSLLIALQFIDIRISEFIISHPIRLDVPENCRSDWLHKSISITKPQIWSYVFPRSLLSILSFFLLSFFLLVKPSVLRQASESLRTSSKKVNIVPVSPPGRSSSKRDTAANAPDPNYAPSSSRVVSSRRVFPTSKGSKLPLGQSSSTTCVTFAHKQSTLPNFQLRVHFYSYNKAVKMYSSPTLILIARTLLQQEDL